MSYLGNLTLRLAAGAARLPEDVRCRQAAYLCGAQNDQGGFAGREGTGDLYYTGFALRGLALLGELSQAAAQRAAAFLGRKLAEQLPPIDFLSLVYSAVLLEMTHGIDVFAAAGCDRAEAVAGFARRLRRDDGGFAKAPHARQSSTYHTFLTAACMQLVGVPLEGAAEMIELIRSRRRDDGGFVELGVLRQSGTNPTAAAVGFLRLLDALDEPGRQGVVRFLVQMQNAEGGLRANTRIPVADLLSTFTGLVALADLDALAGIATSAARRYVQALQEPRGGFRGGIWDDTADVEYTFYGLGAMALLSPLED